MKVFIILSALSKWLVMYLSFLFPVPTNTQHGHTPADTFNRLCATNDYTPSHVHTNKHWHCILTTINISTHIVDDVMVDGRRYQQDGGVWECGSLSPWETTGSDRQEYEEWKDFSVCVCVQISISSDMRASCVETCSDSQSLLHTPLCQAVSSTVSTAGVNKSGFI